MQGHTPYDTYSTGGTNDARQRRGAAPTYTSVKNDADETYEPDQSYDDNGSGGESESYDNSESSDEGYSYGGGSYSNQSYSGSYGSGGTYSYQSYGYTSRSRR